MAYNGSGTFLINTAGQPVVAGTVISSTTFNALTADLATGLSTVITKDGQTTVTANIPMASFKFTGLGVGSAAGDSANLSQVQSTVTKLLTSVSGTDTITAVGAPVVSAYAAGQMFYFVATGDNTTSVTINIDGLGAKAVTRDGSVALVAGDIKSGEVVVVVYDGTRFQVVSQLNSAGNATFANVSITSALNVGGVATFSAGTAAAPSITTTGDTNTGIFFPAADTIGFSEGGVEAARFNSSGVFTTTNDATIQGLTVGRGASAVSTNTAVGASALAANTSGSNNTALGYQAMIANTDGSYCVAVGRLALASQTNNGNSLNTAVGNSALTANTSGYYNTAVGSSALDSNTTGTGNSAFGVEALQANTTASNNTAVGYQAGYSNTTASNNVAVGYQAGYSNTTGTRNVSVGHSALKATTTGSYNIGVGYQAGLSLTTGTFNTVVGDDAFNLNTTGDFNVAIGHASLTSNTTASSNLAVGVSALRANTTGATNVALGRDALQANTTASNSTAVGYAAGYGATGELNTFIGNFSGYSMTTGTKNTILGRFNGNQGGLNITTSSNHIVLSDGDGNPRGYFDASGNFLIGTTTANSGVTILPSFSTANSSGVDIKHTSTSSSGDYYVTFQYNASVIGYISQNGTTAVAYNTTSDYRLKNTIAPMTGALAKVALLKPVTYKWNADGSDGQGFIAHELAEVVPDCVTGEKDAVDAEGKPRYQGVDASFLVATLTAAIQELKAEFDAYKASHP